MKASAKNEFRTQKLFVFIIRPRGTRNWSFCEGASGRTTTSRAISAISQNGKSRGSKTPSEACSPQKWRHPSTMGGNPLDTCHRQALQRISGGGQPFLDCNAFTNKCDLAANRISRRPRELLLTLRLP
jgi:hypothetical protein